MAHRKGGLRRSPRTVGNQSVAAGCGGHDESQDKAHGDSASIAGKTFRSAVWPRSGYHFQMAPTAGKQPPPPTIVFFGLGAVGSSMLICLAELAERDGIPVRFKVFSIDPAGARDALYHAERLMKRIEIIGVPSFDPLLAHEGPEADKLAGAALLVNAAIPQFNCPIIELGIRLGAHTLDLASDMYNPETASSLTFNQYAHDAALRERGVAALVNMGISPGITNFLIGEQIWRLRSEHRKELEIESIDLYLLEDIVPTPSSFRGRRRWPSTSCRRARCSCGTGG